MGRLAELDLSLSLSKEEYDKRRKHLELELVALQQRMRKYGGKVVLVFQGMDAAGKGGAIKRLVRYMDPRGYAVIPTGPPTDYERAHNYLWRFWTKLPREGQLVIFDRSWYERVLVERVEGFATRDEWRRAYDEINWFEQTLTNDGTVLVKFWLHIDKKEQKKRFIAREKNPYKRWKITPDDWRNRKKWDQYIEAAEEMFARTDKSYAPWILVEGNCKRWARLKVIEKVLEYTKDL